MSSVVIDEGTTTLTWENNDFTWDNTNLTWNTAVITGSTITITYDLTLTESFSRETSYIREFTESFNLSDSCDKTFIKELNEYLALSSRFVRNSGSVIYDVALRSIIDSKGKQIDLSGLRTLARQAQVAGYEQGVEFLPGDYDFEEAIVGLIITNNTNAQVGFKEIDVYTDTPDIIDRGSIEITNSGPNYDSTDGYTKVFLNKDYYTAPNITVSAAGGTELAEAMLDPDGLQKENGIWRFRVKLVRNTSGNYVTNTTLVLGGGTTTAVTGTLYWKAVGY